MTSVPVRVFISRGTPPPTHGTLCAFDVVPIVGDYIANEGVDYRVFKVSHALTGFRQSGTPVAHYDVYAAAEANEDMIPI